jgi:putative flippase GtrA
MKLTHQLKRFILTGLVNTGFGYFIFVCSLELLGLTHFWSVVMSYVVGMTFSYVMFRAFVFTEGSRSWRSFARFIPTYVVLFVINITTMHVLVDLFGWNALVAQALVIGGCAVLSFIGNRVFVFK